MNCVLRFRTTMSSEQLNRADVERESFRLLGYLPLYFRKAWVAYTCASLMEAMSDEAVDMALYTLTRDRRERDRYIRSAVPWPIHTLTKLVFPSAFEQRERIVARKLLRAIGAGDVAYLWTYSTEELNADLSARGAMVVREMINCGLNLRRRELRKAYESLGWQYRSEPSDAAIAQERAAVRSSDAVFCPNPFVLDSMLAYGVPEERCIRTTFGWEPRRLAGLGRHLDPIDGLTVLFVGTVDVRKGAPWLLRAWAESGVRGRLVFAGRPDAEVLSGCADLLDREDVILLGHQEEMGPVYRSADVLCFPTWEEGGPLVTFEAMGCGVVPLVSPMGTAGVVKDHEHGLVVEPGDTDALAAALRELADDVELRRACSRASRATAGEYTWEKVGRRRLEALRSHRLAWKAARNS